MFGKWSELLGYGVWLGLFYLGASVFAPYLPVPKQPLHSANTGRVGFVGKGKINSTRLIGAGSTSQLEEPVPPEYSVTTRQSDNEIPAVPVTRNQMAKSNLGLRDPTNAKSNTASDLEPTDDRHILSPVTPEETLHADSPLAKMPIFGNHLYSAHMVVIARKLAREGKLQDALTKLDAAVTARPDYTTAYSERAGVLFKLKQFDKAVADYATVIKMRPAAPASYYNRGLALIFLRIPDAKSAMADFTKVIELNPKATPTQDLVLESFDKRAYCNILLAQWPAAITDCSEVLKRATNRADTLINRAFAYESSTPPYADKAIEDYTAALPLAKDAEQRADIYSRRGCLYLNIKENNSAISDFTAVIGINPRNEMAHYNRGIAFVSMSEGKTSKELRSAIADFRTATKLKPNDPAAWNRLAYAYDDLGLISESDQEMAWTKAIDAYSKFAGFPEVGPADAAIAKNRASVLKEALRENAEARQ